MAYGIESYTVTLSDNVNSPRMSRDGLSCLYERHDDYHWKLQDSKNKVIINHYQSEEESINLMAQCNKEREKEILRNEHIYRSERCRSIRLFKIKH